MLVYQRVTIQSSDMKNKTSMVSSKPCVSVPSDIRVYKWVDPAVLPEPILGWVGGPELEGKLLVSWFVPPWTSPLRVQSMAAMAQDFRGEPEW